MSFSWRLEERVRTVNSHLVIGLDPDPKRLFHPTLGFQRFYPEKDRTWILDAFLDLVVNVSAKTACAVKPQAAFFESMGLSGWKALSRCIRKCRQIGLPVIFDAKRGDIGNTAEAYAESYLNPKSEFYCDALTVNPYLGPDSLAPFVEASRRYGSGIFILVKTSNPGSFFLQDLIDADGTKVAAKIAKLVDELSRDSEFQGEYSDIGAVIGATYPQDLKAFRDILAKSIILVPGFGTQGGTAQSIKPAFNVSSKGALKGALIVSARSIIFAYEALIPKNTKDQQQTVSLALRAQAEETILDKARKTRDEIEMTIKSST